jgi:predicted nucleic acid-binding protein
MRYLLDTSAVLAHYRREKGWEAVQTIFESVDTLIAAAAQHAQAVLVHRDKHMRQIPAALLPQQDLD